MTPHEILEYIVNHKGSCPNDVSLCSICPLNTNNRSCIDTVFPDVDIPFEGVNSAYYRVAYHMLMDELMERALKEIDHENLAPSPTQ